MGIVIATILYGTPSQSSNGLLGRISSHWRAKFELHFIAGKFGTWWRNNWQPWGKQQFVDLATNQRIWMNLIRVLRVAWCKGDGSILEVQVPPSIFGQSYWMKNLQIWAQIQSKASCTFLDWVVREHVQPVLFLIVRQTLKEHETPIWLVVWNISDFPIYWE